MMKLYDETMEALRFSGDFCEKTLERLENTPKRKSNRLPRALTAAACVVLSAALLFGAAWAVSPEFRTLFLQNERIETVEQVTLPSEPGSFTVQNYGAITARYYKLDGTFVNHDGCDGFLPVEKDGKTTIWRLGENGELVEAEPTRHVQQSVDYMGQHWDIDFLIYEGEGDIALGLTPDGEALNLLDANTWTVSVQKSLWQQPIRIDLTTGEVTDQLAALDFTPPEGLMGFGSHDVSVNLYPGGSVALISCHMADQGYRYYRADLETGEITDLGDESYDGQAAFSPSMRLYGDNIYSNAWYQLSVWEAGGTWRSLLEDGERCRYDFGRYALVENRTTGVFSLLDLDTGDRLVLSDIEGALDFNTSILYSPNRKLLAMDKYSVTFDSLNVSTFAVIDPENQRMVTLERTPGMPEKMCGWLDDTHFIIGGRDAVCIYTIE